MEQEEGKNDAEKTFEVSSKPESSEKDDKKDAKNAPEGSSQPESDGKNTPRSLGAKSKIVKKSQAGRYKTRKATGVQGDTRNMEQEESTKDTENALDVSSRPEPSENDSVKKDAGSLDKDNKEVADCSLSLTFTDESIQTISANAPEGSSKPESSGKNTPHSLKAKSKIVKKSQAGKFQTRKATGPQEDNGNMELEKSMKDTENALDVSSRPETSENDNVKKDAESSEKDNKIKDVEKAPEGYSQPESSGKNTPQSSKAKSKIVKQPLTGKIKIKKAAGAQGDSRNMEQEESTKDTENSLDVSSKPESLEKDNGKKDAESSKKDNNMKNVESSEKDKNMKNAESSEKDNNMKDAESSEKDNNMKDAESSEKDDMKDAENVPEGSSQPESSDKNIPQPLKPKPDVVKNSQSGKFKTNMDAGVQGDTGNMEQEESRKTTENSPDVSSSEKDNCKKDAESSEKDKNMKDAENIPKGSSQPQSSGKNTTQSLKARSQIVKRSQAGKFKTKKAADAQGDGGNMELQGSRKDTENSLDVPSKPESLEKDNSKKDAVNPQEGSSNPNLSDKNTPLSLKVNSKIMKKSQAGKYKTNKNKGAQQIQGRQRGRKNKKLLGKPESFHNKENYIEKKNSQDTQQKRTTDEQPEKSQRDENNKDDRQNRSNGAKQLSGKNKEKDGELNRGAMGKTKEGRHGGIEKNQSTEKSREKLGGLIFMCNAKTKPDCFRYRVMGVSAGKKDVVYGVKPGLKLFLYDFDLKLLYGIYRASSSGGMKLEPRAFAGSFPAQVRFNIDKDCFPLPERIFRRAIKENYDEKNKFKTELTVRQVRKLTELFRPVENHSTLHPVHSPPKVIVQERDLLTGVRGSRPHSHRERPARDNYVNSHVISHNVLSHERDHRIERREEIPRDLFLTEKDYRAYGLQGDRSVVNPPSRVNPDLDPYRRDYEREHLHHLDPIYRDNVPARAEALRGSPPYLSEPKYQDRSRGARHDYTDDPYDHLYNYAPASRDSYMPPLGREEMPPSSYLAGGRTLVGAENLRRTVTGRDRLYSTYAADALSEYNRTQPYNGAEPEAIPIPVSSRYSFAGPSYSRR